MPCNLLERTYAMGGASSSSASLVSPTDAVSTKTTDVTLIELCLISIQHNVEEDDEQGSLLTQKLETLFQQLSTSRAVDLPLQKLPLSNNKTRIRNNQVVAKSLWKDVTKFVKISDRYAALASLLLKRRVCHAIYGGSFQEGRGMTRFPLVQLPRIEHNKPYVPNLDVTVEQGNNDDDPTRFFPFSISHQYPFVGVARFSSPCQRSATQDPPTLPRLGMDIVVFDAPNLRLYPQGVVDFIKVFHDRFAPREFQTIQNASDGSQDLDFVRLHELYLQWAVKEAYTKALGVGLGFDFASFETHFEDESTRVNKGQETIWSSLVEHYKDEDPMDNNNQHEEAEDQKNEGTIDKEILLIRRGRVKKLNGIKAHASNHNQGSDDEYWMFAFGLLWDDDTEERRQKAEDALGCVCVAWGPTSSSLAENARIRVEWSKLDNLVALPLHTPDHREQDREEQNTP